MPIKKTTTAKPALGPKAKLLKLSVTTLRSKAKKLGISDVAKRTKDNLAQSILLSEARKKRGTAAGKKATAKRTAAKPVTRKTSRRIEWKTNKDGTMTRVIKSNGIPAKVENAAWKTRSAKYPKVNPSKRDMQRVAMLPGKRKSASGKTYYEYRVNRSDAGMGGERYQGWTNYWTWKYNLELLDESFWREQIEEGYYTNVYDLSKALEESADELVETAGLPDWAEFWISAAFSEVNWYEIAKGIAEDYDLPPNDL
jgi:hypothetical protein